MISFKSSVENANAVLPDSNIFLWTAVSVADVAAVNSNGIKTLLANGLSTFLIKTKPVFINSPRSLPKNPPDYRILYNWVLDNSVLADELFAKDLRSLKIGVLINNNLCRKLVSSLELPTTFDERFKVTSVPIFNPDFNLLSCEIGTLRLKCFIESFCTNVILK